MNGITEKVIQTEYVHEPTLYDVMEALGGLGERIDGVCRHLVSVEARLSVVEVKIDTMGVRIDEIDMRLVSVESRLFGVEVKITDMQEELTALSRAVDTDAVMLLNQQRRLQNVERSILMD